MKTSDLSSTVILGIIILILNFGILPGTMMGQKLNIRGMAKFGTTLNAPDVDHFFENSSWLDSETQKGILGMGLEIVFDANVIRIGAEIGRQSLYTAKFSDNQNYSSAVVQYYEYEWKENASLAIFAEKEISDILLFRAGIAGYQVQEDYHYYYDGTYVNEDIIRMKKDNVIGFLVAGGVNIPIADKITLPLLLRFDFVKYDDILLVPLTVNAGISLNLDL